MTIDDKVGDKKLQFDINREAAKISPLSPGKNHKYDHLRAKSYRRININPWWKKSDRTS